MLCRQEALDNDVEDARPEQIHVDIDLLQMLAKSRQAPLKAIIVILQVLILDVILAFLIYRVVCQVDKLVPFGIIRSILLSGESSETFFEHIDAQRFHTGYAHVDPEVELVPVYQQRVRYVP